MIPGYHLCDKDEEEIRRLLKTKTILVSIEFKIRTKAKVYF